MNLVCSVILAAICFSCQSTPSEAERDLAERRSSAQVAKNLIEGYFQENQKLPNSFSEMLSELHDARIPRGFNYAWNLVPKKEELIKKDQIVAIEKTPLKHIEYKFFIYYSGEEKFTVSKRYRNAAGKYE